MLNYYNFGKRESFFGKISPFEAFFKDSFVNLNEILIT